MGCNAGHILLQSLTPSLVLYCFFLLLEKRGTTSVFPDTLLVRHSISSSGFLSNQLYMKSISQLGANRINLVHEGKEGIQVFIPVLSFVFSVSSNAHPRAWSRDKSNRKRKYTCIDNQMTIVINISCKRRVHFHFCNTNFFRMKLWHVNHVCLTCNLLRSSLLTKSSCFTLFPDTLCKINGPFLMQRSYHVTQRYLRWWWCVKSANVYFKYNDVYI